MINMVEFAKSLIVGTEIEQNAELEKQVNGPSKSERYLYQAPCEDCKGRGYYKMNVEGDALDMVNCDSCGGAGLISSWRRK